MDGISEAGVEALEFELASWLDDPDEGACPPHAARPASMAAPPARAPIFTNDRRVMCEYAPLRCFMMITLQVSEEEKRLFP